MDERPIVVGSSKPRRVVVVGAAGLWRWKFRGGRSADAFTAVWGSVFDWLTGDATDVARGASGDARGCARASRCAGAAAARATRRRPSYSCDRRRSPHADTLQLRFAGETGVADTPPLAAGVYETHTAGGDGLLAVNVSGELATTAADGPFGRRWFRGGVGSRATCPHSLVALRTCARCALRGMDTAPQSRLAMTSSGRGPSPAQEVALAAHQGCRAHRRHGVRAGRRRCGLARATRDMLIESDFGVRVSCAARRGHGSAGAEGRDQDAGDFETALRTAVANALTSGKSDPALTFSDAKPTVILVLGVNGAGKTTFIGKLATRLKARGEARARRGGRHVSRGRGRSVRVWAERAGVDFVSGASGGDPAAVAFSAIDAGVTRGADVIIVDTAGRLHTSDDLMEELRKVARVIAEAPAGRAARITARARWHDRAECDCAGADVLRRPCR